MRFLGDEGINPISGQSYRLLSPKPKTQWDQFLWPGPSRSHTCQTHPLVPSPRGSDRGQDTGSKREQAGSFPSIWPSQHPRRVSPALSTRPEPTLLQDEAHPARIASDPGSCDPQFQSALPAVALARTGLWLRPNGGGAWAFALSQTPEERGGQPLPSSPPPEPRPPGEPLKGCRPGCAFLGSNRPGACRDLMRQASGVNKPGLLGKDLQAKCRGVHLDDPLPSAAGLLS